MCVDNKSGQGEARWNSEETVGLSVLRRFVTIRKVLFGGRKWSIVRNIRQALSRFVVRNRGNFTFFGELSVLARTDGGPSRKLDAKSSCTHIRRDYSAVRLPRGSKNKRKKMLAVHASLQTMRRMIDAQSD